MLTKLLTTKARLLALRHPALSQDVQRGIASSGSALDRAHLACNPAIVADVLDSLASDSDFLVRWSVADNPQAQRDLVDRLARTDSSPVVARAASARVWAFSNAAA